MPEGTFDRETAAQALARAGFTLAPLPGASFGGLVGSHHGDACEAVAAAEAAPEALPAALYACHGLLVWPGLEDIAAAPELLVRLSRLFGDDVEDYRQTLTPANMIHVRVPEILVVSNLPPCDRAPPPRPAPPLTADGGLPVQFPHRRGWHTDQSFRRPPPDVSLFFAEVPAPPGQGQTLYADGIAAYATLPADLKARIEEIQALHVLPGTGRSEQAVRAGETPRPLAPHERSQPQPLVRIHPVTGERALYLCEAGQLDWVEGPVVGLEPGPDGAGAELVYMLMHHYTQARFVHVQNWARGDLVIYDNRSLIHAATWFDADNHGRVMWRTTTRGNPGPLYAGEAPSWLPAATS